MVLNRSHLPWAVFVLVASAVAGVLFLANYHPHALPFSYSLPAFFGPVPPMRRTYGGTPLGLFFGSISLAIFFFASALGIRKKRRLWRIGLVQTWLRGHIWLTLLTVPLILLHCGFHFGGVMTSSLMLLYAAVMVSGLYGFGMQQFMPRLMTQALPQEVVYEQIPHIRGLLLAAADALWKELAPASGKEPAPAKAAPATTPAAPADPAEIAHDEQSRAIISEFMQDDCFPYLRAPYGTRHRLSRQRLADDAFRVLKLNVTPKWQEKAEQMQSWCSDRRQLDLQAKLHHWLHWWLVVHVPLSFALLVITVWHAWVTVAYL